jgi:hypothetical protein
MRKDIQRVVAAEIYLGDVICFPEKSLDFTVEHIYIRMDKKIVFNKSEILSPADHIFIQTRS